VIESIETFDQSDLRIRDGMILTGVVLLIMAAWTLLGDRTPGHRISRARIYVTLYAFCTALFAFIRASIDTNKILLVGAATHNAFEWGLFGVFAHSEKNARVFFAYSVAWIWLVMTVTIYLPKLIYSFFFEQSFGLWCDYFMLFIYAYRFYHSPPNSPGREIFKYGLHASLWHFGQVYSLIGLGIGVHGWVAIALEWMLIFSAVPTFYLNRIVALKWEEMIYKVEYPEDEDQTDISRLGTSEPNEKGRSEKDSLLASNHFQNKAKDLRIDIPALHKYLILGSGLLLSWITIFGPLIIPECLDQSNAVKPTPQIGTGIPLFPEIPSAAVTGVTIIDTTPNNKQALLEELQQMLVPVRKEAGSISYNLFENTLKPGQFAFVETWASLAALQIHLQSPNVKAVFDQPYYNSLVNSTKVIGPFQIVEPGFPVSGTLSMVFQFTVNCPIDYVWPKISNFSESPFVSGAKQTYLESPDVKVIVLEKGSLLKFRLLKTDNDNHQWIEQMVSGLPYKAYTATITLTLGNPQNMTMLHYLAEFVAPDGMSNTDARNLLWSDFYHYRIPYVKKLFDCDTTKVEH